MYCVVKEAGKKECENQCYDCQCHERKGTILNKKHDIPVIEKPIKIKKPDIEFNREGIKVNGRPLEELIEEFLKGLVEPLSADDLDAYKHDIPAGGICPEPEDLINKPNHYHKGGIDIYEILQVKLTPEEYRGFCKGNIAKYLFREDMKGGVDDIKKLRFNADRLIENMNGEIYIPEYKQELLKKKG